MKICIYGAGGPVARAGIALLEQEHELLLTDLAPMETPHPFRQVDITDVDQVTAAAEGMDVLINCTVYRPEPTPAFDVNLLGAYNLMRAAVAQATPRVIQTGPGMLFASRGAYQLDHGIDEDVPPQPGMTHYILSKYLGYEIIRTFCRHHPELTVLVMVYGGFFDREVGWLNDYAVDARDAAQAFVKGVAVPREKLPTNCEHFNICADIPHGRMDISKPREILGFEPEHNWPHLWSRRARAEWEAAQSGQEA